MANRKRKCKYCGEYVPAEFGIKTPVAFFCSHEHAIQYAQDKQRKDRERNKRKAINDKAKREKADRKRLREKKKAVRPLKWYADRAQREFNKFIRLRDAGLPCISCGKPDDGTHQRHASHYRSRGACSSLRFDENNCHASCSKCNNWLSGNIEGYTPELIKKIGAEEFERIQSTPKSHKWAKEELIAIYEKYKAKCKSLN